MNYREELTIQAANIIGLGEKVLTTEGEDKKIKSFVDEAAFHDFRISGLSFLSRVFGEKAVHYKHFFNEVTQATASRTRRGIAILTAARRDLENNWLESSRQRLSKDILTDILRLANIQIGLGNYGAAATIAGSVLEEILRLLCLDAEIKIHNTTQGKASAKRALQLSGEAYKKGLYERSLHRQMLLWIELYEQAVTGKSEGLGKKQAQAMLSGVQNFLENSRKKG